MLMSIFRFSQDIELIDGELPTNLIMTVFSAWTRNQLLIVVDGKTS